MDLGWCDVCLRVSKADVSRRFYRDLGLWRVEGSDEEGWAVMTNGDLRLGLFEPQFMSTEMSLNFRGGNVAAICDELRAKGHSFAKEPKFVEGGGSASMIDPDGHAIFIDAQSGETKKVDSID
jgi:catechol 2,3-dioxygenase-like lactoylglutathione lyase family enzyme